MEHLISLLHNVKPTREWQREITEELDEIAREISPHLEHAKEKVRELLQSRRKGQDVTKSAEKKINIITIDLILTSITGSREPEIRQIGKIIGYLESGKFLVKELILKGVLGQRLLGEITDILKIKNNVFVYLRQEGLYLDPFNVDIKIEFRQHPSEARTRVWYKRDGRIEIPSPQEFRLDFIPIVATPFNITKLDFDLRTEVLHLEAHI